MVTVSAWQNYSMHKKTITFGLTVGKLQDPERDTDSYERGFLDV